MINALFDRIHRYTDNPDPLAKVAATVALVVASNQPFYPLYLHAIVGKQAWPAWLTLLTTPLFLAVPAVARRHSLAGRAMLPIVGVINTVLCVKLIGLATAVELFLLPCILLAAILFRTSERNTMVLSCWCRSRPTSWWTAGWAPLFRFSTPTATPRSSPCTP